MNKIISIAVFLIVSLGLCGCASTYPQKPVAPIVITKPDTKIVQSNVPLTNQIAIGVGDSASSLTQSSTVIKTESSKILNSTTEPNTKVSATVISNETINLDNLVNRLLDQQKQISDLGLKVGQQELAAQTAEKTANDQITTLQGQFKTAIDNQAIGFNKVIAAKDTEIAKEKSKSQEALNALLIFCIFAGVIGIAGAAVVIYLNPTAKLGIAIGIGSVILIAISTALMTQSIWFSIGGCALALVIVAYFVYNTVVNHKLALSETVTSAQIALDSLKKADPVAQQKIVGPSDSPATPGILSASVQSPTTQALVGAAKAKQGI